MDGTTLSVLRSDMSVSCLEPEYQTWRIISAIILSVYGFGVPAASVTYLAVKRKKLVTEEMLQKIRFLYEGYVPRYFFWEVVIMARKFSFIAVIVFLRGNTLNQLYTG